MLEVVVGVLGMLGAKRWDDAGGDVARLDERGAPGDPHPGELGPVLRPAVDEDRHVGALGDVAHARERPDVVDRLGLLVER